MIQALLFILSIAGFFLLSGKTGRHWGFVVSLCAQPFWFYSSWKTGAWGVFALAFFYTGLNIRGIRNHWPK
jgi:hypothetical protein